MAVFITFGLMKQTTTYGLVGRRLGHSFSRQFFSAMFAANDIDAHYLNFELPDIGDLMEMLAEYDSLRGFNVTVPYKELILPYLDKVSPEVTEIGAANVVKVVHRDGDIFLKGYNTDLDGFAKSLRPQLTPDMKSALVLGSGGASKAVVCGLRRLGIEPLVVSRTPRDGMIGYDDITADLIDRCHLIVNATPLGMFPDVDSCPPLPYNFLDNRHLCYDLVYNPAQTMFMRRAAESGASVCNGLEMLMIQAFESWHIWNS